MNLDTRHSLFQVDIRYCQIFDEPKNVGPTNAPKVAPTEEPIVTPTPTKFFKLWEPKIIGPNTFAQQKRKRASLFSGMQVGKCLNISFVFPRP